MTPWKTDKIGIVFKTSSPVKLYFDGTWKQRLFQFKNRDIRILTYTLPKIHEYLEFFEKNNVWLICHESFEKIAQFIKNSVPKTNIATIGELHSKVVLVEPKTVFISSANFGASGWKETTIGIKSKIAHDEFLEKSFNKIWKEAIKLEVTEKNEKKNLEDVLTELKKFRRKWRSASTKELRNVHNESYGMHLGYEICAGDIDDLIKRFQNDGQNESKN